MGRLLSEVGWRARDVSLRGKRLMMHAHKYCRHLACLYLEAEMMIAGNSTDQIAETQAMLAARGMMRCLILLFGERADIRKVRNSVQQGALLTEAKQKYQCEIKDQSMQHDCILSELL